MPGEDSYSVNKSAPLFNSKYEVEWKKLNDKASAVALSINAKELKGVLIKVGKLGIYESAEHFKINFPTEETEENTHIFKNAKIICIQPKMIEWPWISNIAGILGQQSYFLDAELSKETPFRYYQNTFKLEEESLKKLLKSIN